MAEWSAAEIDNLPDSSFAYIEPGGSKDADGKTTPRSLRHLPYKTASGAIDHPHLVNALQRLSSTKLSAEGKAHAAAKLQAAARSAGVGSENKSAIQKIFAGIADLLAGSAEPIALPALLSPVEKGDREPVDHYVAIVKASESDEQRLVYGLVYEPGVEDAHGDTMTAPEIEKAAHGFMTHYARFEGDSGTDHLAKVGREAVTIVESFIAPVDFALGGQVFRKGSWVMAAKVWDDALWKAVKTGKFTGWSFEGWGRRMPAAA